jgi:hypothetical protein
MRRMKSKELPINISGHIEWGRSGWAVRDKNFFVGEGNTAAAAREVRHYRGTLLKMVPLAWPSTMVGYKASAGSVLISYVIQKWPGDTQHYKHKYHNKCVMFSLVLHYSLFTITYFNRINPCGSLTLSFVSC